MGTALRAHMRAHMSAMVFLAVLVVAVSARKCSQYDLFAEGEFHGIPPECGDLDLYKKGLDDDAALKIAEALKTHENMKWISLSENKITEKGAAELAKALETNSVLTALKLWDQKTPKGGTEITKSTLKAIKAKLKKNKDNPYSKEEEAMLAQARKVEVVPDKVTKHVLEEGTGEIPGDGAKVTAHYTGTLANGEKFDSSRDRGTPFEFTLGKGQVIGCWDKGFATMKKGEKALLTCHSDLAYGDRGSPPKIPGGATLKFDVELLDFAGGSKTEL